MKMHAFLLHALSPLHVGTGQGVGVIDLPLARMRATRIPIVPGSALKGVLRATLEPAKDASPGELAKHTATFGPMRDKRKPGAEGDTALDDHAGALVVGDARLLALPVRAFAGTFAYVTCPLLLELARRDCPAGAPAGSLKPPGRSALVADLKTALNVRERAVYLEELKLDASEDSKVRDWAQWLAQALPSAEREPFKQRLVVVDDDTMDFLWETATQIDTRIRLDQTTGTVAQGALWTEESLPAETLLVGVMAATASLRADCPLSALDVLEYALRPAKAPEPLQVGGKATVGRGLCRVLSWTGEAR